MTRPIIEARGLSKRYRLGQFGAGSLREEAERLFRRRGGEEPPASDFWALQDVSFDVEPGEAVGVIGRNGAGKSTLLKLLSRVTEPTAGEARLRGRVASLLEVGTGFHPELSGRENIYLNGAILGMTRAEIRRKFDEIVAFAEVERFLETPVKRYSSGMYVRLAFAVAAHLEPEILIVDEVLAVGDAEFQKKCLGKMKDISQRDGRTILLVSHNVGLIQQLSRKALYLERGRVAYFGETRAAVQAYLGDGGALSTAAIDATQHPNRLPKMRPVIKTIQVVDANNDPARHFLQGAPITVVVGYDACATGLPVSGLGIMVDSSSGARVASLPTYSNQQPPFTLPRRGTVRFTVRTPHLNPGAYQLSVCMTHQQFALLDSIEPAVSVEVLPADIYETGFILSGEDGLVAAYGDLEVIAG